MNSSSWTNTLIVLIKSFINRVKTKQIRRKTIENKTNNKQTNYWVQSKRNKIQKRVLLQLTREWLINISDNIVLRCFDCFRKTKKISFIGFFSYANKWLLTTSLVVLVVGSLRVTQNNSSKSFNGFNVMQSMFIKWDKTND